MSSRAVHVDFSYSKVGNFPVPTSSWVQQKSDTFQPLSQGQQRCILDFKIPSYGGLRVRESSVNIPPVQCLSLPASLVRRSWCRHRPAPPWLQRKNTFIRWSLHKSWQTTCVSWYPSMPLANLWWINDPNLNHLKGTVHPKKKKIYFPTYP